MGDAMAMKKADWISGFAWPIPRAFSGPVFHCRFEQGDVLYAEPKGYQSWGPSGPPGPLIQILDPPKSARALSGGFDGDRLSVAWTSPVTLQLYFAVGERPVQKTTSQGRLLTALWRGDLSVLEADRPEPPVPGSLKELHGRLSEAIPVFSARLFDGAPEPDGLLFLLAVDDSSESGRAKADAIEARLIDRFQVRRAELAATETGVPGADTLHPALRVRGLAIETSDAGQVEAHLSGLLYGGSGHARSRFSLSRHGLLRPTGSRAGESGDPKKS